MAATLAAVGDNKLDIYGSTPAAVYDVTLDNSYPAGGYVVTAAQFGFRGLAGLKIIGINTAGVVNNYAWNSQTGKLMVLRTTAGVAGTAPNQDATPAADFSTVVLRVLAIALR